MLRLLRLLNVFKRALQLHWLMAAITSGEEQESLGASLSVSHGIKEDNVVS